MELDKDRLLKQIQGADDGKAHDVDVTDPRERAKIKAQKAMEESNYYLAFEIYNELGLQHQKEEALRKLIEEKPELSEFKINKIAFYGRENLDQALLELFKKAYGLED